MNYLLEKYRAIIMSAFKACLLGDAIVSMTTPEITADIICLPAANMGTADVNIPLSIDASMESLKVTAMEAEVHPDLSIVAVMHLCRACQLIIDLAVHPDLQLEATMVCCPAVPIQGEVGTYVQLTCVMHCLTVEPLQGEVDAGLSIDATLSTLEVESLEVSESFEGLEVTAELTPLEVLALQGDGEFSGVMVEGELASLPAEAIEGAILSQLSIEATMNIARKAVVDDYYGGTVDSEFYGKTMDENSLWLTIIS